MLGLVSEEVTFKYTIQDCIIRR